MELKRMLATLVALWIAIAIAVPLKSVRITLKSRVDSSFR
jgi:hypothetical protein